MEGARPFAIDKGGNVGCFLIHGFTASPQALEGIAAALGQAGISSVAPLLPGHGTSVHDLNRIRWEDLEAQVGREFLDYRRHFKKVIIVGESAGGNVALRLAARYPDDVAGVVSVGGSLLFNSDLFVRVTVPFYRWLRPTPIKVRKADVKDRSVIPARVAYDRIPMHSFYRLLSYAKLTEQSCPRVHAPLLVLQAVHDHAVSPKSAEIICAKTRSPYKKLVWFHESYHILLIDLERQRVFDEIVQFAKGVADGSIPVQSGTPA